MSATVLHQVKHKMCFGWIRHIIDAVEQNNEAIIVQHQFIDSIKAHVPVRLCVVENLFETACSLSCAQQELPMQCVIVLLVFVSSLGKLWLELVQSDCNELQKPSRFSCLAMQNRLILLT